MALRVGAATEFDLNVVFKLPFYRGDFDLVTTSHEDALIFNVVPGSAVYCTKKTFDQLMPSTHPRYSDYKFLRSFFESFHYSGVIPGFREYRYVLLPQQLSSWFQGIVYKTTDKVNAKYTSWWSSKISVGNGEKVSFSYHKAGPAYTLKVVSDSGMFIDVDLVPVFQLSSSSVVLVPKPYPRQSKYLWRLSYPDRERRIFHDQSCAKKVLKLLKRFRDMQGAPWKKLSSYYLKTLVMLVLDNQRWLDRNLYTLFIQCLKRLLQYLSDGKIPLFHDQECNLLQDLNRSTISNMKGRLERIMKDIDQNPPITLRKYFVLEECSTGSVDGAGSSCQIM
ncbi:cyclic GMP-AMP synthase-like receptor [Clytia hemisphaerica]|uniref:Mab-21-like HhH/H2TH-like domain-containing protein n=1 Tax=Clytia hemisphaerica TaxID=252671 RepID=A0A7M5VAF6_9CNID